MPVFCSTLCKMINHVIAFGHNMYAAVFVIKASVTNIQTRCVSFLIPDIIVIIKATITPISKLNKNILSLVFFLTK